MPISSVTKRMRQETLLTIRLLLTLVKVRAPSGDIDLKHIGQQSLRSARAIEGAHRHYLAGNHRPG